MYDTVLTTYCRNGAMALFVAITLLVGCGVQTEPRSQKVAIDPPIATAMSSGNPVIAYDVVVPKVPQDCVLCLGTDYAVIQQAHPTQEQLIDLAINLHSKDPSRKFEIVDSAEGIHTLVEFFAKPLEVEFPNDWAAKHLFAAVVFSFMEGEQVGRWKLTGRETFADSSQRKHIDSDETLAFLGPVEAKPENLNKPHQAISAKAVPTRWKTALDNISDFQKSEFCKRYRCRETQSFVGAKGNLNSFYDTTVSDLSVNLSVRTDTSKLASIGLVFHGRHSGLSSDDFGVIETLIRDVGEGEVVRRTMRFVRNNIVISVCSTCSVTDSAEFSMVGPFRVTAGDSLEAVLSLVRVWPD